MKKSLSVFLTSVILIFSITTSCFADIPDTAPNIPDGYSNFKEYLWQIVQDVGYIGTLPAKGLTEIVNTILRNNSQDDVADQITTDNQAANWLINNGISIDGNGNTVLTGNSLTFVKDLIKYEMNQSPMYYVYSFNIIDNITTFPDGDYYNALRRFLVENQDSYCCFLNSAFSVNPSQTLPEIILSPKTSDLVYIQNNIDLTNNRNSAYLYNYDSWVQFQSFYLYRYNNSLKEFELVSQNYALGSSLYNQLDPNSRHRFSPIGWITVGRYDTNVCYRTLNDLKRSTQGIQPYYVNNSVYKNFQNSDDDYTVTTDNSNHATYSDVTNYINNYYDDNDEVPTPDNINIFIEDQRPVPSPTPNPDNPSGGGSVSVINNNDPSISNNPSITNNPTFNNNPNINISLLPNVSGNGLTGGTVSGNGQGSGGFFDWISDIGDVIGDFIKNVGQLIADVVRGISDTITTIMSTIPNLLSSIVEFVYGGLPEELKALVTLGITAVVLVSVIKILRK